MGVSKFIYGDQVKFDITDTTATPETVLNGYTFHGANGEALVGNAILDITEDTNKYDIRFGDKSINNLAYLRYNYYNGYTHNGYINYTFYIADNIYNTYGLFGSGNARYINLQLEIGNNVNLYGMANYLNNNHCLSGDLKVNIGNDCYISNLFYTTPNNGKTYINIGNNCKINNIFSYILYEISNYEFVNIGDNCLIDGGISYYLPKNLYIGNNVNSNNKSILKTSDSLSNVNIIIGNNSYLNSLLHYGSGYFNNVNITIGDHCNCDNLFVINTGSYYSRNFNIKIGNDCNCINMFYDSNISRLIINDFIIGDNCNCYYLMYRSNGNVNYTNIDNLTFGNHCILTSSTFPICNYLNNINIGNNCYCYAAFSSAKNSSISSLGTIRIGDYCDCHHMFYVYNRQYKGFPPIFIGKACNCYQMFAQVNSMVFGSSYVNRLTIYMDSAAENANGMFAGWPNNRASIVLYTNRGLSSMTMNTKNLFGTGGITWTTSGSGLNQCKYNIMYNIFIYNNKGY